MSHVRPVWNQIFQSSQFLYAASFKIILNYNAFPETSNQSLKKIQGAGLAYCILYSQFRLHWYKDLKGNILSTFLSQVDAIPWVFMKYMTFFGQNAKDLLFHPCLVSLIRSVLYVTPCSWTHSNTFVIASLACNHLRLLLMCYSTTTLNSACHSDILIFVKINK